MKKIIFALIVTCFVAVGCKNEEKKKEAKTEVAAANIEETTFAISGMTCEIGCAKHIASKLSKVDGVINANVIFTDSIAKVKFDKTKTDAKKLMAYVDGMADNMYKTSEAVVRPPNCKCEGCKGKTTCSEGCKNECNTKVKKKDCKGDCNKDCCKDNNKKKECKEGCTKACCADKKA